MLTVSNNGKLILVIPLPEMLRLLLTFVNKGSDIEFALELAMVINPPFLNCGNDIVIPLPTPPIFIFGTFCNLGKESDEIFPAIER